MVDLHDEGVLHPVGVRRGEVGVEPGKDGAGFVAPRVLADGFIVHEDEVRIADVERAVLLGVLAPAGDR